MLNFEEQYFSKHYSEKFANDDMMNCAQGLKDFLRAYYHVKSADWSHNNPFRLNSWSAS